MLYIVNKTAANGYGSEFLFITALVSIFFGICIIIAKNPITSVLFLIGLFISISLHLMMLGLHFIGLSYLVIYVGAVSMLFLFILMLVNVRVSELITEGRNSIPLAMISVVCFDLTVNTIVPYCIFSFDIITSYIAYIYESVLKIILHFYGLTPSTSDVNTSDVNISDINVKDIDQQDVSIIYNGTSELKEARFTNYNQGSSSIQQETLNQWATIIDIEDLDTESEFFSIGNLNSESWDNHLVGHSDITSVGGVLYTEYSLLLIIISFILLLAMVGCIVITIKRKR